MSAVRIVFELTASLAFGAMPSGCWTASLCSKLVCLRLLWSSMLLLFWLLLVVGLYKLPAVQCYAGVAVLTRHRHVVLAGWC